MVTMATGWGGRGKAHQLVPEPAGHRWREKVSGNWGRKHLTKQLQEEGGRGGRGTGCHTLRGLGSKVRKAFLLGGSRTAAKGTFQHGRGVTV